MRLTRTPLRADSVLVYVEKQVEYRIEESFLSLAVLSIDPDKKQVHAGDGSDGSLSKLNKGQVKNYLAHDEAVHCFF